MKDKRFFLDSGDQIIAELYVHDANGNITEITAGRSLTLGGLLESLRLSEEMSQIAFAKKLKISPSHLCDIEKGRKTVSAARAAHFASSGQFQ